MKPTVVRKVARPDAELVKTLGGLGVATVHEAQGRTGLMRPYMRPIYPTAKAAGAAITISCHPGDNLMIHAAIEFCREGDVLVVSTTSESTDGMFGELLAESAGARCGWFGYRCRCSRCAGSHRDAVSGVVEGRLRARDSQSDCRLRERSDHLRRFNRSSRRCDRCRCRRRCCR